LHFGGYNFFVYPFVRKLITEWRRLKLPTAGQTVIVAVSGGADSVSLLLAMHELKKKEKFGHRLVAAHFNHQLRGAESDSDEAYVRQLTVKLGVELAVGRASIPSGGNLEQNARNSRYAFLAETAESLGAFAVVTGHTVNDQAETFLMNLVRGSGPSGLRGMIPIRHLEGASVLLVRPLLNWAKRRETEGYCRDQGVEYCYDTMNEDTAFKRVRIRKILLPLLEDMNPNIVETLANTASLMPQSDDTPLRNAPINTPTEIPLADLRALPQAELYATLRSWLAGRRGNLRRLQLKHIQAIERLVHSGKSGRTVELPGGVRVIRSGGKLRYEENEVEN